MIGRTSWYMFSVDEAFYYQCSPSMVGRLHEAIVLDIILVNCKSEHMPSIDLTCIIHCNSGLHTRKERYHTMANLLLCFYRTLSPLLYMHLPTR